jgi:hypothetical protein
VVGSVPPQAKNSALRKIEKQGNYHLETEALTQCKLGGPEPMGDIVVAATCCNVYSVCLLSSNLLRHLFRRYFTDSCRICIDIKDFALVHDPAAVAYCQLNDPGVAFTCNAFDRCFAGAGTGGETALNQDLACQPLGAVRRNLLNDGDIVVCCLVRPSVLQVRAGL